jgi:D-arginine dehydrogenase
MNDAAEAPATVADFLIIGAGIAGASMGHWLAPHATVTMLEAESQPGYHATGRSAAAFIEGYGPAGVRALSRASGPFFRDPRPGFSDHPLLRPRGLLTLFKPEHRAQRDEALAHGRREGFTVEAWTVAQARAWVPLIRDGVFESALHEPDAADMDVHAIHQGYLRGLRAAGGQVVCDARVVALDRDGEVWQATDDRGRVWRGRSLVNAAGAWADEVATLAGVPRLGLQPRRRAAFLFEPTAGVDTRDWPLVITGAEDWYVKPDAGLLLGSPANADATHPQDVQPEIEDIAGAIERIESDLELTVGRPRRTWAGLRTFAPDGELVGGWDPLAPAFFWVAGQGGYGIQTSPAMGRACAAIALGRPLDEDLVACGIDAQRLGPARLRGAVG